MKNFKKSNKVQLIFLLFFGALLLSACTKAQAKISLEYNEFNFGDVENGKIMTKEILVENTGDADLIVDSVSSSCGCTKASLEPMTIQPGETGTLSIEFDSGAHGPELTGELIRHIFIMSNDPEFPETVVEFSSNVILPNN